MINRPLTPSVLLTALLLTACATTQAPPQALVDARSTLRSVELNTDVQTHAPLELRKATASLNRANQLLDKRESTADITSAAYIATQQAKTAMAIAKAKSNDLAIAGTELERERVRADMRTLEAQRAQASASSAQAQTSAARQEAANAEQRAAGAEAQAAAANAGASEVQRQNALLRQSLNELQTQQTERGMLVTLGDVLFEFNRAEVKPGAQNSLRKLADFLAKNPSRRILIEGHADSVGTAGANTTLSRRRADSVGAALEALGVTAQRVTTLGYGEDYPIADNNTDTNRALNRRVEVYISENDQPVRRRR